MEDLQNHDTFDDNPNIEAVPVIVAFNKDGKMKPLYFMYFGMRLKIDHTWRINERDKTWYDYVCEVTLIDRVQVVRLSYDVYTQKWVVHLPVQRPN